MKGNVHTIPSVWNGMREGVLTTQILAGSDTASIWIWRLEPLTLDDGRIKGQLACVNGPAADQTKQTEFQFYLWCPDTFRRTALH